MVMDQIKTVRKLEAVTIKRNGKKPDQLVWMYCGTIFSTWLPEQFHTPPAELKGEALASWHDKQAMYRWSRTTKRPNGGARFICPQCAGRITSSAKTRKENVTPAPSAPYIKLDPDIDYCCGGPIDVPVEGLDLHQTPPYGTTAWKKAYGRRSQIENINGILKNKGALKDGWCRSRNRAAYALAAMLLCFAHNLDEDNANPP